MFFFIYRSVDGAEDMATCKTKPRFIAFTNVVNEISFELCYVKKHVHSILARGKKRKKETYFLESVYCYDKYYWIL